MRAGQPQRRSRVRTTLDSFAGWPLLFPPLALAFVAGLDLVFVHYFLVREAAALLAFNEGTALLAIASFFLSFSLGYALGPRLRNSAGLARLGFAVLLLQLCFPWALRYLAAFWIEVEFAWINLILVPAYLVLCGSVFHAALLTHLADRAREQAGANDGGPPWPPLRQLYAADLLGAIAGLAIAVPTLVVTSSEDPFFGPEVLPEASELADCVRLEVSPYGGHVGPGGPL